LRFENRSENFKGTIFDIASIAQNVYAANYTLPLVNTMTLSLGANYGDVRRNELSDRYGFDATASFRIFNHHNLTFFMSRNRDERKNWNDVGYVFLTLSFPDRNDYLSTL